MNVNDICEKYENLANAIIVASADDYRFALDKLCEDPDNKKANILKEEVVKFFRSQWFKALTNVDGNYLLKKIREEILGDKKMDVILYTTGCPQCNVLKQKLDETGVKYTAVTDTKVMLEKGFATAPMLEVDGKIMGMQEAYQWVMNL